MPLPPAFKIGYVDILLAYGIRGIQLVETAVAEHLALAHIQGPHHIVIYGAYHRRIEILVHFLLLAQLLDLGIVEAGRTVEVFFKG